MATAALSIIIDQPVSVVAKSEIVLRSKNDEPIELGWAFDADGNPTTDAKAAPKEPWPQAAAIRAAVWVLEQSRCWQAVRTGAVLQPARITGHSVARPAARLRLRSSVSSLLIQRSFCRCGPSSVEIQYSDQKASARRMAARLPRARSQEPIALAWQLTE